MNIIFLCNYCNHKWEDYLYSKQAISNQKCPICLDSNPVWKTVEESQNDKVDYYKGSKPFIKLEVKKDDDDDKTFKFIG